ncbi:hypothetical protein J6590_081365 [Homalodisca vitripennis]|nr:hypothetical protein J6590_081365 [Homalodisca vitripennis]
MGKYPCGKCEKNVKSSAILCSMCNKWFHFKCVNLTITDVKTMEKEQFLEDWRCLNCYSIDKNESMIDASTESTEENSEKLNYSSLADEMNKSVLQENEYLRKELHSVKHKSSFYILELEDKVKQNEEDYELLKKESVEKEQELLRKMKVLENKLRYEKEAKEKLISEVEEENKASEHVHNYTNRSCDRCVILKEETRKMLDTIRSLESIIGILEREKLNTPDTICKRTGDPNCLDYFSPLNGVQQPTVGERKEETWPVPAHSCVLVCCRPIGQNPGLFFSLAISTLDVEKWLKVPSRHSVKPINYNKSGPKFFSVNPFEVLSDVSTEEVTDENECIISSININTAKSKVHQANYSGLKAKQVHCHNTCENKNKDTLLICADSHGSGLSWHINKNQNSYSAVRFVRPGGRTKDILDFSNISTELKSKDDVLVIFCGTNDISRNEANEAITGITDNSEG